MKAWEKAFAPEKGIGYLKEKLFNGKELFYIVKKLPVYVKSWEKAFALKKAFTAVKKHPIHAKAFIKTFRPEKKIYLVEKFVKTDLKFNCLKFTYLKKFLVLKTL